MSALPRAVLMLLAAAAAGALLWIAAQFNTNATGGYWAALGVIAAGGLLLGLTQLRGPTGNPPLAFLFAFVPVAVMALWVIVVAEPDSNTFRSHLTAWDSDLGISRAVHDIGRWNGVLALGVGLLFGLAIEPGMVRRRRTAVVPVVTPTAVTPPVAEPVVVDDESEPTRPAPIGPTASQH